MTAIQNPQQVPPEVEWLTLAEAAQLTGHSLEVFQEIIAATGVDLSAEGAALRVARLSFDTHRSHSQGGF